MAKKLRIANVDVDASRTRFELQAGERRYCLILARQLSEAELRWMEVSEFVAIGVKRNGRLTMQSGPNTMEVVPHRDVETWELRTESRLLFIGGPGDQLQRWLRVPWYQSQLEYWANRLGVLRWLERKGS